MANGGGFAAYDNSGNYDEGLDASYDAFHDDVTAAYLACMMAGLGGSQDGDAQIADLAEALGEASHKFMLSAKIDTEVTVPAQPCGPGVAPDVGPIDEQTGVGEGHLE